MLIEIQKRKCLHCGHTFRHPFGGVVLIDNPKCPVCGSRMTMKIADLPIH